MRFTRKIVAALMVLMITLMPMVVFASNDVITVTIDGQAVAFPDQQPIMVNSRVLVPVGGVFEALGFTPSWNGTTRTATLTRDDYTVVLTVGSANFTINGVSHELDVPAQLISGRTMVPLGPILRGVGYELDWVGSTRTVVITTGTEIPWWLADDLDPEIAAFIDGMDMDRISAVLGVVFTLTVDEDGVSLNLSEDVFDVDEIITRIGQGYRMPVIWGGVWGDPLPYDLPSGGVGIFRDTWGSPFSPDYGRLWMYGIGIDLGTAVDYFAALGWEIPPQIQYWIDRGHHPRMWGRLLEVRLFDGIPGVVTSIDHFLSVLGYDAIRDALGMDFEVNPVEHSNQWFSSRMIHPATPFDIYADGNMLDTHEFVGFTTQTGDILLGAYHSEGQINSIFLYIDLGRAFDLFSQEFFDNNDLYWVTEDHRAVHRIQLFGH